MTVYTPETLAKKWECSARTIRNPIQRGELRAFRLGDKLLRIPEDAVEEFLRRRDTWAAMSSDHSEVTRPK